MTAFAVACAGQRSRPRGRTTERNQAMGMPAKADVDDTTKDALTGLALGDAQVLESALALRDAWQERSGLDARPCSLVEMTARRSPAPPPAPYLRAERRTRRPAPPPPRP